MKRDDAGVADALKMEIISKKCEPDCPVTRARAGDQSARLIRPSDTVMYNGVAHLVSVVAVDRTVEPGNYAVCGTRRRMYPAVLIFLDGTTAYADSDIKKLCTRCREVVP